MPEDCFFIKENWYLHKTYNCTILRNIIHNKYLVFILSYALLTKCMNVIQKVIWT